MQCFFCGVQVAVGTSLLANITGCVQRRGRCGGHGEPIASKKLLDQGWLSASVEITSADGHGTSLKLQSDRGLGALAPLGSHEGPDGAIFGSAGRFKVQWTLERVLPGKDVPELAIVQKCLDWQGDVAFAAEVCSKVYKLSVIEPHLEHAHFAKIEEGPSSLKHMEPFSLTLALSFDRPSADAQRLTPVQISLEDAAKLKLRPSSQLEVRCANI